MGKCILTCCHKRIHNFTTYGFKILIRDGTRNILLYNTDIFISFSLDILNGLAHYVYIYPTKKEKETHIVTLTNFLKDRKYYNNFVYIILKTCHWLLNCTSFNSRSQTFVQENWLQTRWGSICKITEKLRLCYVVSQDKIKQCKSTL